MSATLLQMQVNDFDPMRESMRVVLRDSCADYMAKRFCDHWNHHPNLTLVQAFETFPRFQFLEEFMDMSTAQFYGG